jgi:signal transduction histidine kinase
VTQPSHLPFALNRLLLRSMYLLVLGYMMASFGGFEIALRQRLRLLRDVSTIANPRFGVDYTIGRLLERLRHFYDADLCLLITYDDAGGAPVVRRAGRSHPHAGAEAMPVPRVFAERLLGVDPDAAVILHSRTASPSTCTVALMRDLRSGADGQVAHHTCEGIVSMLEARDVLTVPVLHHEKNVGRLYVTSQRYRFHAADVELATQLFQQVIPVIDNIRLVDRLASEAAECERRRIARDIHDSVIQSFIGIQLALHGLQQRCAAGLPVDAGLADVEALVRTEVGEARRFVSALEAPAASGSELIASLRRFVSKFSDATGIRVQLMIPATIAMSDRLAAEAFQIVEEGLSNVRRHTAARSPSTSRARRRTAPSLRCLRRSPLPHA